jgi:hyaluronan synthase
MAGLLAVLLVLVNVFLLKRRNIEYFWYQPVFNAYSLAVAFYIISRFAFCLLYRRPKWRGHEPSVTIAICAKNEGEVIGETIRRSFSVDYPREKLEVIAVNDGSSDGTASAIEAARQESPGLVAIHFQKNRGKRAAMAEAARRARGEVLVYVDSDSFLRPDAIRQIVQPLADPEVGAVAGHTDVENSDVNVLTRMQAVRYYVAFRVIKAAESVFSCVTCCPGCFSAYRRAYVLEVLDEWENQRFFGRPATFGDDRSLTNFMLRRYRVLYHSGATATTIVPEGLKKFLKQQLRWKKSWARESLIASTFMWKKPPLMALSFYLAFLFPVAAPLVVGRAMIVAPILWGTPGSFFLYGVTCMSLLFSFYYLLAQRKRLWIYGVLFALFYMSILIWQTPYALLTIRQNHWGTR